MAETCVCCEYPLWEKVAAPCPFCHNPVCVSCLRSWALTTIEPAHCMNPSCKREFSREDLVRLLGQNFVDKTYKEHRKNQLLSLEKSLLPVAQAELERLWGEDVPGSTAELEARAAATAHEIGVLVLQQADLEERLKEARELASQYKWAILRRKQEVSLEVLQQRRGREKRGTAPVERRAFVHKCPVPDCRGFLSSRWCCGICRTYVCPDCGVPKKAEKDEDHTCKKEDIATMEFIRKEARKCPGCGEAISKIDGCDQMWCPSCKTAFSWKTGAIVNNERVHNPHYFEWLRQNPNAQIRDVRDIDCGGVPVLRYVRKVPVSFLTKKDVDLVCEFARQLQHHHEVTLPKLSKERESVYFNLRLRYLNGELTESRWKQELMRNKKKAEYEARAALIVQMLISAGSDLLRNLEAYCKAGDASAKDGAGKSVAEIASLVVYAQEQLAALSKAYKLQIIKLGLDVPTLMSRVVT